MQIKYREMKARGINTSPQMLEATLREGVSGAADSSATGLAPRRSTTAFAASSPAVKKGCRARQEVCNSELATNEAPPQTDHVLRGSVAG